MSFKWIAETLGMEAATQSTLRLKMKMFEQAVGNC
jgi:hypothetical protein